MSYNKFYNQIRLYEGEIVTFIKDENTINDEFIRLLSEDLKLDYKIVNQLIDYHNITEKTIVIMDYDKSINFKDMTGNKNVILFVLRDYFRTSNTQLFGSIENVDYVANFILFMKNERMKIFILNNNDNLDKTVNINKLNRNIKLKLLSKK